MESHRENNNGCENTETMIPSVSSGDQEGLQNKEETSPIIKWSKEFQCFTVNGILAPIPLSAIPMETVMEDEESTITQVESRKERSETEGNEEIFFRLFKFQNVGEQYLLEMHEAKADDIIDQYHLFVHKSNGRWKVKVYDRQPGNLVVLPVLEDPTQPMFQKKYDLSLQERLVGWIVEKRKEGNGKGKKFYYHQSRQFRSFAEVAAFILYSNKLKDLQINKASQV